MSDADPDPGPGSTADPDSTPAVAAVGAYAPGARIEAETVADAWGRFEAAGIDTTAVPDADEDALTMAWEAGRRALAAGDADPDEVAWLGFATTTPPLAEEDLTARLGSFFGVPDRATRQTFTGSTRAGTRALFAGLDADLGDGVGLVVASDCPRGSPEDEREHAAGAGAAAVLLAAEGPVAVRDRAEYAEPYPGTRFRRAGSDRVEGIDVTSYDRAAFRETLAGAVEGLDAAPLGDGADGGVDAAAVQAPDGSLPYRVAGALGVDRETVATCATVADLGDTAAASVPLSLSRALADGHERVLAASFGSGAGADATLFEADRSVPADLMLAGTHTIDYPTSLRRRGEITGGPPAGGGAYVSVPSWQRSVPQRHRLVAGLCRACGDPAFPPAGACPACGSLEGFEETVLPPVGRVETLTAISRGGEPPEFAQQQQRSGQYGVAIVAFEAGGGSVSVPLQTVGDGADLAIDDEVRTVVRRIYEQEGVVRYGRKVRPA